MSSSRPSKPAGPRRPTKPARPDARGGRRSGGRTRPGAPHPKAGKAAKAAKPAEAEGVRLQRVLAQAGVASRRAAESLIAAGRVRVDGKIVSELGTRVDPATVSVEVDGEVLRAQEPTYLVMNKPDEVVTSAESDVDPQGRPTVVSLLSGLRARVVPLGRLDFHTRGVLLLSNDGALHAALLHPRRSVPKTYHAKFQGRLGEREIAMLHAGVQLEDGTRTRPSLEVEVVKATTTNTWVQLTISQGLNRQIRRMGEAIGHAVLKLIRVAFAGITADGLREGQWRHLRPEEVASLYTAAGLSAPPRNDAATPSTAVHGTPVFRTGVERAARERAATQAAAADASDRERATAERSERAPRQRSDRDRPTRQRSDRDRPTSARSDRDRPTTPRSDRDRPTTPRSDRDRPTAARSDRDRPTTPHRDRDRPTTPRSDRERPTRPRSEAPGPARPERDRAASDRPARDRRDDRPARGRRPDDRTGGPAPKGRRGAPAEGTQGRGRRPEDAPQRARGSRDDGGGAERRSAARPSKPASAERGARNRGAAGRPSGRLASRKR
jgi:23S rRNA pseudouridine2605 synthase